MRSRFCELPGALTGPFDPDHLRVTRLPLKTNISCSAAYAPIEAVHGIWQAPRRLVKESGGWQMGRRVAMGLVAVVVAMTSVEVSSVLADETGLASMHALRREAGRLCMSDHWHYGSSATERSKRTAQRSAIRSWQDFTDLEYGSNWARWSRARSKKIGCSRSDSGWSCNVEARPCK